MESLIRKLVREEVADTMQMPNQGRMHMAIGSSVHQPSTSSRPVSTPSQGKSGKIASKLNGLINKINSKPTKLKGKKLLRLQVHWIREDADGDREIVKQVHDGGKRFVFFEKGEVDITFHSLLIKAIELFFPYPAKKNYFDEAQTEVSSHILDATQTSVNLFQDIHDYFKEKGLFPSKTYFCLEKKPKVDFEQEESKPRQPPLLPAKRKICAICSCTYFINCMECRQNNDFNNSLATDQQKEVNETLDSISNEDEEPEFETLAVEQLILQRIYVFQQRKSFDLTVSTQQKKFETELEELREVFNEVEDTVTLAVRRRRLFSGVMRKMELFFDGKPLRKIKIDFISAGVKESCIDTGGPSREMYLLLYDTAILKILQGTEKSLVFIHDMHHLQEKTFCKFGQLVALSILTEYDTPHQLSEALVYHMLGIIHIILK